MGFTDDDKAPYRINVAAVVRRETGEILVCERSDFRGAWQFPQGGVDKGESHREALERELEEEISLRPIHYRIVNQTGPYRYRFPGGRRKRGYHGQEQTYYLVDFLGPDEAIDVNTHAREFLQTKWIRPGEFNMEWLPATKRPVYQKVLLTFFGIDLP